MQTSDTRPRRAVTGDGWEAAAVSRGYDHDAIEPGQTAIPAGYMASRAARGRDTGQDEAPVETLVVFLQTRLAEDEQTARDRLSYLGGEPYEHTRGMDDREMRFLDGPAHPARVLAEVEAKRRIVGEIVPWIGQECDGGDEVDEKAEFLLRLLAAPYADHPDFREEWKP